MGLSYWDFNLLLFSTKDTVREVKNNLKVISKSKPYRGFTEFCDMEDNKGFSIFTKFW